MGTFGLPKSDGDEGAMDRPSNLVDPKRHAARAESQPCRPDLGGLPQRLKDRNGFSSS